MFANAGIGAFEDLAFGSDTIDKPLWDINYNGTIRCVRAAAAAMKKQRSGHILITSSIVALTGLPYYATYAATKAAQHGLSASLGLELEPHNISVTCVFPSSTATSFHNKSGRLKATEDPAHANTPQWMVQTPQHVARCVLRAIRKPRPEVWPSFFSRWMVVLWTAWPWFRSFSFRRHAEWTRTRMAEAAAENQNASPKSINEPSTPSPTTEKLTATVTASASAAAESHQA